MSNGAPIDQLAKPRSRFFWVAMAVSTIALGVFSVAGARAVFSSADSRTQGWTEAFDGDAWRVAAVDAGGPADDALQPGDQLVAVNGDRRAERIGGLWFVEAIPPGGAYTVDVQRDARPLSVTLTVGHRGDSSLAWVLIYLATAAAFLVVSIVMAVARPGDRTIQYGFLSSVCSAGFLVWLAARPVDGVQQGVLTGILGLTFPLQVMGGLLFFNRFPQPVAVTKAWTTAIRLIISLGVIVWLARLWILMLRALPADWASGGLDASLGFVARYRSVGQLLESGYSGVVMALILAVLVRNYRMLSSQGERRRVQFVLWSNTLALVPMVLVAVASPMLQSVGLATAGSPTLLAWTLAANALLIVMPLSFGYAIVKHRVLGFRVFVRLGIQYILAQNVLRAAAVLPALFIALGIVSNPDRTVGEVIYSAWSGGQVALIGLAALALRFRAPLEAAIDRRFFRTAYDQEKILLRLVDSIKALDSLSEISALVSREIDAALHVSHIAVFYRSPRTRSLELGYSSVGDHVEMGLPPDSPLLAEMVSTPWSRTRTELRGQIAAPEEEWLDRQGIELVVPITGIDRDLCGLLLLGAKRSEEPFTSKDRNLLQMVAAQVSAVYEILALREQVGNQHRIQTEVLSRLERQQINVVRECPRCGLCCDSTVDLCPEDGERLVPSLPVDRTVDGKYRLERLIGHGGMGAVYEATDLGLQRRVAVKVVRSNALGSAAVQRRFQREARACGRLTHPNIVHVYDFGVAGETAYLVMEYVRGVTLRAEINRLGRLPVTRTAALLDQVLDGMDVAHRAGVLHRDLKPENLLVEAPGTGENERVKILDFGLAKVREANFVDPKSMTSAGIVMGTFGYMSPEQLYGEDVDERTDVYAMGVIALETLTGRIDVEGRFFHQAIEKELTRRLYAPGGAPERHVANIIRRALAEQAAERFGSMRELRAHLIPALHACPELPLPGAGGQPGSQENPESATQSPGGLAIEAANRPTDAT